MFKKSNLKVLPYIIIFIFALFVVSFKFLLCRSLWLDEAALANNILLKDSILNNVTFLQSAPPLFKLISLFSTKLFGVNEYALRLFPLLCFIFSTVLFYFCVNKLFKTDFQKICAFFAFCFNPFVIYYAVEFKQYSCDLFVALLFIYFCLYFDFKNMRLKNFAIFSIFYALVIWLSHFALFLFIPLLMFFIFNFKSCIFSKKIFIFIFTFLISFLPFYFLHLNFISGNVQLHNYWQDSFVYSFGNFFVLFKLFLSTLFPFANFIIISVLLIISFFLFKNDCKKVFLILFFISPFLASFLSLYPFNARLFLPLVPLILIFIFSIGNNKNVLNYLLFLVFLPYFAYSIFFTVNKNTLYREEMRPLLSYLSKNVVNDEIIYLKRGAHQAFRFYTLNYDKPYNFDNEIIYEQNCPQNSEFCNLKKGKIWVICAQNSDNLPKNAHLLKRLNFRGNNLYYIVIE